MPQQAWTAKQERQYNHIKRQSKQRGYPADRAEEIAARTVNKERARSGHATRRSLVSTEDISAPRRGGIRSGNRYGPGGRTKRQLYADAQRQGLPGRSTMTKQQLEAALRDR
ncbi:hypothetical protein EV191_12339 [Tamaricihabitans halophyticus]|uniref:Plasmid stabilization protein n=1 Tax=Tamaricihabitans halophyticus TaxID=1262583 RepID=A0A4R2Q2J2_9PSEU|nr:plasmid stabilization protein [Tamaricihabitans halophyticus]TCP42639.1 hypothetical protein EV191_12339 [Tamaricihabitans halophyticus]